jgi:hypothetical protein
MPKHHEKKKKKKYPHKETINLEQLRELAKAHRHQPEKKKPNAEQAESRKASMVPLTKAEHDKEQSVIRKVVDPATGRTR